MANIVDRRNNNKNKLAGSRAKFITRNRLSVREAINSLINKKSIKSINKDTVINITGTKEVQAKYNPQKGKISIIRSGNDRFNKGDGWDMPPKEYRRKGSLSSGNEISEDNFIFSITKDELMSIIFEEMKLPNFLKKSDKFMQNIKYITGGYVKEGIPARLALKKTLENSVARRIAAKSGKLKSRFIDDIDLRYRNIVPQSHPVSHAVVFMIMDVSGSMNENRKLLSKKFFLLFYLFLNKNYKSLEIRFISHTEKAQEVTENEFFYSRNTGGTYVSSALELTNKIIDDEYDIETTNIYVTQASDGDYSVREGKEIIEHVTNLLPKIQFFAYIEIDNSYPKNALCEIYAKNFSKTKKLKYAFAGNDLSIFEGLKILFGDSNEK
jgi:hypothetical protein